MKDEQQTFKSFVKQLLVPTTILIYVSTSLLQLKDNFEKLGIQVLIVTIFLLILLWTIYVWKSRIKTPNDPAGTIYKYNTKMRYGAIIALFLSVVPLLYTYEMYLMPVIRFEIDNKRSNDATLEYFNTYTIEATTVYGYSTIEDFGLISTFPKTKQDQQLYIKAKSKKQFYGKFMNDDKVRRYIASGDHFITLRAKVKDGTWAESSNMLLLTKDALRNGVIALTLK